MSLTTPLPLSLPLKSRGWDCREAQRCWHAMCELDIGLKCRLPHSLKLRAAGKLALAPRKRSDVDKRHDTRRYDIDTTRTTSVIMASHVSIQGPAQRRSRERIDVFDVQARPSDATFHIMLFCLSLRLNVPIRIGQAKTTSCHSTTISTSFKGRHTHPITQHQQQQPLIHL